MVIEHGYLVERYLPDATIEQVADATSRARELAREAGIRYLWSAFVPEEGSCFCLFTAPSAEKVRVVNEQAGFPFAHIFPAVSAEVRGGGRESNPPDSFRRLTGFEDRGAHQAP